MFFNHPNYSVSVRIANHCERCTPWPPPPTLPRYLMDIVMVKNALPHTACALYLANSRQLDVRQFQINENGKRPICQSQSQGPLDTQRSVVAVRAERVAHGGAAGTCPRPNELALRHLVSLRNACI
jgi:hypothetical protein